MKFKYTPIYITIALGMLNSSCNKWLDVKPKAEVHQEQLFSTATGFKDALYGTYSLMGRNDIYGGEMTMGFMSVISHDYDLTETRSFYYKANLHKYTELDTRGYIDKIWERSYNAISNANNILAQIDGKSSVFGADDYRLVKAEALGIRAYLHFDIFRLFAPAYDAANSKLLVPYITTISKTPTASSPAKQFIDQCFADLNLAETLLADDPINSPDKATNTDMATRRSNHFNIYAVKALKARIYLYIGDKVNALKYADEVINSKKFPLVVNSAVSGPEERIDRTFSSEHVFSLYISDLVNNANMHFRTTDARYLLNNNSTAVKALYEVNSGGSTDYRYVYLWKLYNGTPFCSKFWQLDEAPSNIKYLMPLIRVSELYYIAAECIQDTKAGFNYLNQIREHRGRDPLNNSGTKEELQEEIRKEYRKEFFAEGQTFFYYKRLKITQLPDSNIPGTDNVYVLPKPELETEYGK
ncbi:RagB/SusD family nutrient uptake outer membrane protein [Chitinophaga silvatica]|nr:RagB/SusD family nutrient uptake outer membrane protein [Chitinophaga silvatica]